MSNWHYHAQATGRPGSRATITMPTNTEKLLATEPDVYERATKHPFLSAVGRGVVDKGEFGQWMRQDRLYIQLGFARFAGALLAKNPVPSDLRPESKGNRQFRARLAILSNAVQNADRCVRASAGSRAN